LGERAWGTVREDYSEHGQAWEYFPHDHARSRAYRWSEDGLGGGDCNGRALLTHMGKYQARLAGDAILGRQAADRGPTSGSSRA
ncbi:MAG: hypothetical protein ACRDZ4_01100, partial [Egibacteraceae bacterium]